MQNIGKTDTENSGNSEIEGVGKFCRTKTKIIYAQPVPKIGSTLCKDKRLTSIKGEDIKN